MPLELTDQVIAHVYAPPLCPHQRWEGRRVTRRNQHGWMIRRRVWVTRVVRLEFSAVLQLKQGVVEVGDKVCREKRFGTGCAAAPGTAANEVCPKAESVLGLWAGFRINFIRSCSRRCCTASAKSFLPTNFASHLVQWDLKAPRGLGL